MITITFKLTSEQKKAISHNEGNMLILACAGSGKTTVITRRIVRLIEEGICKPNEIVAITFTVKAAEHMKNEIVKLLSNKNAVTEMFVGTIHAFCLDLLKNFYPNVSEYFEVINEDQQFLILYQNYYKWNINSLCPGNKKNSIEKTLKTINLIKTERPSLKKIVPKNYPLLVEVVNNYNNFLQNNRLLDFPDLLLMTLTNLENDQEFLNFSNKKCKFLVIDEYQDVDRIQQELIERVSQKINVCVVGDDDQCIYQFRGTDVEIMKEFKQKFKAKVYPLSLNLRSGNNVIDLAKFIIKLNKNRIKKEMTHLHKGGVVTINEFDTIQDEVRHITNKILELNNKGIPFSEMAILLRSVSSSGEQYINGLKEAGIRYTAKGDCGLFKTREIIIISSIFEFLIQNDNTCKIFEKLESIFPSLCKIIENPSINPNLSKNELIYHGVENDEANIVSNIIKLRENCNNAKFDSLSKILFKVLEITNFVRDSNDVVLSNIGIFSELVRDFEEIAGRKNLREFVGFFSIYAKRNFDESSFDEPDIDAVKVMTVHQAKGLDFEVVFCPMLVKGRFPVLKNGDRWIIEDTLFDSSRYKSTIEDERRVFYVMLTRPKCYLHLSCAADIGLSNLKKPSKFLQQAKSITLDDNIEMNILKEIEKKEIQPIEVSFSALEYYFTCPYRYKLRIKSNILPPDNPFLQYGQAIHHVLKIIHEKALGKKSLDYNDIKKIYEKNFYMRPTVPSYVIKLKKNSGLKAVTDYFKKYQFSFNKILYAEKDFEMFMTNDRVIGRFDLIKKSGNDSINIIDFKTGKPRDYLFSKTQMKLYALAALSSLHEKVKKCILHYIEHDQLIDIKISDQVLKKTYKLVEETINGIKHQKFSATPGDQCSRCEYRKICKYAQ